jgi:hypothetical protein
MLRRGAMVAFAPSRGLEPRLSGNNRACCHYTRPGIEDDLGKIVPTFHLSVVRERALARLARHREMESNHPMQGQNLPPCHWAIPVCFVLVGQERIELSPMA